MRLGRLQHQTGPQGLHSYEHQKHRSPNLHRSQVYRTFLSALTAFWNILISSKTISQTCRTNVYQQQLAASSLDTSMGIRPDGVRPILRSSLIYPGSGDDRYLYSCLAQVRSGRRPYTYRSPAAPSIRPIPQPYRNR